MSVLLKNTSDRIITVRLPGETPETAREYQINPGEHPAIEVPDEAMDLDFVKALIEEGHLKEVKGSKEDKKAAATPNPSNQPVQAPAPADEATLEDLRKEAEGLGIEVDKRWGEKRLRDEIEAAKGAK